MTKINPKLLLDVIYPIGSIYINTTGTNPSTFLGGTWVNYGAGRVLVGQDTNDSDFDTIGETGGSKELQAHTHKTTINHVGTSQNFDRSIALYNVTDLPYALYTAEGEASIYPTGTTGTGNSGNLQPYIVVSIWQRTA